MASTSSRVTFVAVAAFAVAALCGSALQAQTAQRPTTQGQKPAAPRPAAPTTKPPATTAKPPAPAAAKPAEPAPPPKPVVTDVRMKTAYTTAGQKTESVTYRKGQRERFEFGEVIVIKQHDLKRTLQIMTAANSYMVVPDGAAPAAPTPAAAPGTPAPTPGVVAVTTTITDTGERKTMLGLQARHAKVTIDKQPAAAGCDPSRQHIETDGWYVDLPAGVIQTQDATAPPQPVGGCLDQINATVNGDPKVLGFPVSYSTTITGEDGKPNVIAMEITELEIKTLDASLFEPPAGMMEMGNLQALTKAVSDANETKLAASLTAAAPPVAKTPGMALVGVPEIGNKTNLPVDTRGLRDKLVTELAALNLSAAPLAAGQADLAQQAGARGYDYVLTAEVTELKVSKPGSGIGGILKGAAAKAAALGTPTTTSDPAEATIAIKLVQPDGKNRYSTNAKGKTGGGTFDVKNVAKSLGTNYVNLMTGRLMMNALNKAMYQNLGGMGVLNDPNLLNMQVQGMNVGPQGGLRGLGLDPTARAASFLMQQSMAATTLTSSALGAQAPSLEEALADALKSAAKSVSDNLKKR